MEKVGVLSIDVHSRLTSVGDVWDPSTDYNQPEVGVNGYHKLDLWLDDR